MDIFNLSFGILLIVIGVAVLYVQTKDGSYKKGTKITDAQVKITYGGIMAIAAGILFIVFSF